MGDEAQENEFSAEEHESIGANIQAGRESQASAAVGKEQEHSPAEREEQGYIEAEKEQNSNDESYRQEEIIEAKIESQEKEDIALREQENSFWSFLEKKEEPEIQERLAHDKQSLQGEPDEGGLDWTKSDNDQDKGMGY